MSSTAVVSGRLIDITTGEAISVMVTCFCWVRDSGRLDNLGESEILTNLVQVAFSRRKCSSGLYFVSLGNETGFVAECILE